MIGKRVSWKRRVNLTLCFIHIMSAALYASAFSPPGTDHFLRPLNGIHGGYSSLASKPYSSDKRIRYLPTIKGVNSESSFSLPNARRNKTFLQLSKYESSDKETNNRVDLILNKMQNIPPPLQLLSLIAMYILHLTVLTQHVLIFPFQLFPNDKGRFQSIGLDSVAGMISFSTIAWLRRRQKKQGSQRTIPSIFEGVDNFDPKSPWTFPKFSPQNAFSPRATSMVALCLLISAYFFTGRFSAMVELNLFTLAGLGVPLTIAMHRSLVVLGGHIAWVFVGSGILRLILRPQPFFGGGRKLIPKFIMKEGGDTGEPEVVEEVQKYKWYSNKWKANWLWWTIGGYFISSWVFNIADFMNQVILPAHVFELAGEGVVSQLINPENNDFLASIVGYIAPCISAPWWEEVLYRGFLLPALCLQMKFWPAVFVSGVIFSVHHVSTTGAIPLAILGWTWAAIYAKSGNLLVTILIHAMWNSRVFLGSWLGL